MNRFCFAILLLGLALLASSSANIEAAEPLVFKKEIKLSEDAKKLIGDDPLAIQHVLFVENEALVALFCYSSDPRYRSRWDCVGVNRLELKTNKSVLVTTKSSRDNKYPQMHFVKDTVWINPLGKAFKQNDLTDCTPLLESGDKKLTFTMPYRLRTEGKTSEMKFASEGSVTIRTTDVKETKTHEYELKLTLENTQLKHDNCADPITGAYLFWEGNKTFPIPDPFPFWLIQPRVEKDAVISFSLPAPPAHLVYYNDKKYLITCDDGNLHSLNLETKKVTTMTTGFNFRLYGIALSKDKQFAICTSWSGDEKNLVIVDLETEKVIFKDTVKGGGYRALSLSPDEKLLAVTGEKDVIRLYDVNLPAKK